jgi:hypothetical protein
MSFDDITSCKWCFEGIDLNDARICEDCHNVMCEDCIVNEIVDVEEDTPITGKNCPCCNRQVSWKDIKKVIGILNKHSEKKLADKLKNSQLKHL